VRVSKYHFELVPDRDSGDHIANGAADGSDCCVSLLLLEPHSESQSILIVFGFPFEDFDGNVPEALLEGA